ncbi:MAG: aspartate-alanine antiporter, partial [Gammaproteobacteria bacterium]|nr:aspartate-alanine antiporter [Gammaproteobacteria bacterium]
MFSSAINLLHNYPQIVVFLAIAIGYYIGKLKLYGFSLGSTTGVLVVALLLGQINIPVPQLLQNIAFALFIFCIGYQVGPQFFGAIKTAGLKYIWLALVVAVVGLLTAIFLGRWFHFDPGTTAGILGGAMTQSAIIGTAGGAIKHLGVSVAEQAQLNSNVAVAYAITYIFGTAGLIMFFRILPRLMGLDFKATAKKLEIEMNGGELEVEGPELFLWTKQLDLRAYRVACETIVGKTLQEIEALFPDRVAIDKIKRADKLIDPTPELIIQQRDVIALVGCRDRFINADKIIGPEVDDKELTNLVGEVLDICVLNSKIAGKTLGELSAMQNSHGLFLKRITRQGREIPVARDTVIHKCDVLSISGTKRDVEAIVKTLGYPERSTKASDLVMVGIGCVIGTLFGLLAIPVVGIPITLGVGGGVLVAGLGAGWLRSIHPTFGQIPDGAQWIFTNLGLNLFIACIGLSAGPKAWQALQTAGFSIFFAGVMVTLLPMVIGVLFGKYILKLNPVLLFGGLTGAGTSTAALNSLEEDSGSSAPTLGYAVPFAFGNV